MNNRAIKYKCPGAKRLMLEARELREKTEDYWAQPIDDNLFEWHFTVKGPPDTAFEGGYYHGRLSFPTEYPMKPPSIILLNPNGRFVTNKKICLSISGYHPETWLPSWSVRTALLALIAFMPTKSFKALGSLDFSDSERRKLASESRTWQCETCGLIRDLLKQPKNENIGSDNEDDPNEAQKDASEIETDTNNSNDQTVNRESDIQNESPQRSARPDTQTPQDSSNTEAQNLDVPNSAITNSIQTNQAQDNSPTNGPSTTTNSVQDRRTYPTLVYASIFILLFVLLLRRAVMLVQA